jgi:hypothetical protein
MESPANRKKVPAYTDDHDVAYRRAEHLAEAGVAFGQFAYLGDLSVDVTLAAHAVQDLTRLVLAALGNQPVRALVLEEHAGEHQDRRHRGQPNISRQFWVDASP